MYLGQLPTATTPLQTMQMTGTQIYSKKFLPKVGQPYSLQITDEQVMQEVYKDLPSSVKQEPSAEGTEPQKLVVLKSGLEVPAYILKRDQERKVAIAEEKTREANYVPPLLEQVGIYTSENPLTAALITVALGAFAGNVFYKYKAS